MYDVIIIGAGVIGSAIARELSKKTLAVAVLEKNSDIGEGTSKANSGIVHSGFDAKPGTLKASLNVAGNHMMGALCKELDISFQQNGSLVLCFQEEEREQLEALKRQGEQNGVVGLQILSKSELQQMEPNVSQDAIAALYAPSGGIICPFGLTIALAENACENGVDFHLNTTVTAIKRKNDYYEVETTKKVLQSKLIVNAAGVYTDVIHHMVSKKPLHITPRRGEYCLFDQSVGAVVTRTIFQLPTKLGKGVLVTPTVHGNLLIGPTAMDIKEKEATNTTMDGLQEVLKKAGLSMLSVPRNKMITSFSGIRAHEDGNDFIIEEVEDAKGFIDVAGIESPGLTAAPAIGEYVARMVDCILPSNNKEHFKKTREAIPNMATLSMEERKKWIANDARFAHVICRCEMVTEGEIVMAIHRPLGATTLDGVKRRTRAGMGRCQAGFCTPKTMEILARELHIPFHEICKNGEKSRLIVGENKDRMQEEN